MLFGVQFMCDWSVSEPWSLHRADAWPRAVLWRAGALGPRRVASNSAPPGKQAGARDSPFTFRRQPCLYTPNDLTKPLQTPGGPCLLQAPQTRSGVTNGSTKALHSEGKSAVCLTTAAPTHQTRGSISRLSLPIFVRLNIQLIL